MLPPVGAHPNWSEMNVNRLLESEYVCKSRHVCGVPLSSGKTDRFVSVQTRRAPLGEHVVEKLPNFAPLPRGPVAAATGPADSSNASGSASEAMARWR